MVSSPHTHPAFFVFYFGAKHLKESELRLHMLRLILTLWIHSCLHLAALLPKVTLPVPAENPNILNGPERTSHTKRGEETSRVTDHLWRAGVCFWEAIWMHCFFCVLSCSMGPRFHSSTRKPRCCCASSHYRDFNHLLLLPLCLCFSKHLCSTSTLRMSALEGEFPS